jgi:cell division septal protein FtsQ
VLHSLEGIESVNRAKKSTLLHGLSFVLLPCWLLPLAGLLVCIAFLPVVLKNHRKLSVAGNFSWLAG